VRLISANEEFKFLYCSVNMFFLLVIGTEITRVVAWFTIFSHNIVQAERRKLKNKENNEMELQWFLCASLIDLVLGVVLMYYIGKKKGIGKE
jgi:hypothetical protein